MSTTLDVIPGSGAVPSFNEVIHIAEARMNERFLKIEISEPARISVWKRRMTPDDSAWDVSLEEDFFWDEDHYMGFGFNDVPGLTDARCRVTAEDEVARWREECRLSSNLRLRDRASVLIEGLKIGHQWSFRRSAGQPGIVSLGYGLLAASLAELTDGLILSMDGAWDFEQMPATSEEFFESYFVAEKCTSPDRQRWSNRCLQGIAKELRSRKR